MYENVLVAVDPYNPAHVDKAIAVAESLTSTQGSKITLVTVLADIPPYLELNLRETEEQLQGFVDGNSDIETLAVADPSSAGAALVELSTDKQADLIIIASHRPGLKDYFLGSTAARVVRHSKCAVHVIR